MTALLSALLSTALAGAPACVPPRIGETVTVPTEQTAISLTKALFAKRYGTSEVQRYEPYHAALTSGIWHVYGTFPSNMAGGTPEANVCQKTGAVLGLWHGK